MSRMVALILHYRTPARTQGCIESLLTAGCRDIVIVDNSADHGRSMKIVTDTLPGLQADGISLTVVDAGRNLGFAAGVNLGLRHARARGPVRVMLINSDARIQRDSLSQAQALLDDGAELVVPEDEAAHGGPANHYARFLGLVLPFNGPGMIPMLSGALLFISERLAADDIFDEAFFFYGEDVELAWRLAHEGRKVVRCPTAVFQHEGAASARRGSLFYEYHTARGHWLLASRLNPGVLPCLLAILGRCLILPMRAAWRSLRARRLAPVQGLVLATTDVFRGKNRDLTPPLDPGQG
ncbi:MAG: hypothetical protein RL434_496 [Pseudomonadota bacterium]|jgi:GT2 family glycosyltransferase